MDWNATDKPIFVKVNVSHSLWVRGLKSTKSFSFGSGQKSRTPCECVDWNFTALVKARFWVVSHSLWVRGLKWANRQQVWLTHAVALLVSAWIEMVFSKYGRGCSVASHSLWVRGLKFAEKIKRLQAEKRRTPCECVDWNKSFNTFSTHNFRSHSLWVRGLKYG